MKSINSINPASMKIYSLKYVPQIVILKGAGVISLVILLFCYITSQAKDSGNRTSAVTKSRTEAMTLVQQTHF